MGMPRRETITEDQLQGFKYFKKLCTLLDRLHDHATQRDRAGNRVLHYDQYIALQLLFFFNPIVTSMRGLVQASTLKKVQQELGVSPTSLGSFSEAGSVFDAQLLKPIISELGAQLKPLSHDARLDDLPGLLTAVDGTELSALAELVGGMIDGRDIKLHAHFEPLKGVPVDIDLMQTPAQVVGLIFRQRWTVEIFFRFFKHVLGCRHLLSHRHNGIEIQVYMAVITCMLIALWTGRKATLRTVEMIRFYFIGWADADELENHIAKLKKTDR